MSLTPYTTGLTAAARNTTDGLFTDAFCYCFKNVIRILAGAGSPVRRIQFRGLQNRATSTYEAIIQFGPVSCLTTAPNQGDQWDILVDGYVGTAKTLTGADSSFRNLGISNVEIIGDCPQVFGKSSNFSTTSPAINNVRHRRLGSPGSSSATCGSPVSGAP